MPPQPGGNLFTNNNNKNRDKPIWLSSQTNNFSIVGNDLNRKPTRLEALPNLEKSKQRKRSGPGPILNTMGTF